ncbi:PRR35 protein, partial [Amia calva]|nr:PRR35 protein [Amia calva]
KHKERKPKKPHYIPRPWGKPYNYKCFQCPFTCMEKSHLYNHMKYSLCKNSLSLLIESDWPYKKGNLLHPEQVRPLQTGPRLRGPGREELDPTPLSDDQSRAAQSEVSFGGEEAEEGEEHGDGETSHGEGPEEAQSTKEGKDRVDNVTRSSTKRPKQTEADFVITDVFSLEDQLLNARAVEVEAKLKHYKLSKTCLTGPSLLSEQWHLLATSHRKAGSEGSLQDSGSIPCYPPPPTFADCQDPPGLNLSVLGVSYPLSPGLFSYVNPAVAGTTPTHAQLAQLPFLASAAQLMQPPSSSLPHTDRTILPPRFYYPLLCEHAFGSVQEPVKGVKPGQPSPASMDPKTPSSYPPKISLWKVPALRPNASVIPPAAWASHQQVPVSPEAGYKAAEEKAQQAVGKESKVGYWSHKAAVDVPPLREQASKRTGAPLESQETLPEKKPLLGCTLDLLKNIRGAPSLSVATDKLLFHSSRDSGGNPQEPSPALKSGKAVDRVARRAEEPDESVVLLGDLSKALQEYQEAERKISRLVKEDSPGQRYLREHLYKIRGELSHIHQALEKTARQHEGPLDLSVKKTPDCNPGGGRGQCSEGKRGVPEETEEEEAEDEEEEEEEEEEEDEGSETDGKIPSQESRRQSREVLLKMSHSGLPGVSLGAVVKMEMVSPSGLGLRPIPTEAVWPSRTTKCEADSSVLLCPDGRSAPLVFTDFSAKSLKRPPSKEHPAEALCPPSPLTAID